jgi:ATP-binding cassette subfamily B protein
MSPAARMLRPYVVSQWRALAGAGGATAVLTAADLAKPWPLALVVDRVLAERTVPFSLDGADVRLLALVAAITLAIALAEGLAQYGADLWLQSAGERIAHDLRVAVYDHLQRLSLGFHQQREKGDLLTRVTGDVNAMGDLFAQSLGEMVQAGLLAAGMTVVLLFLDPVLALVSLAATPLMAAISFVFRRRVRSQARLRRKHDGRIASVAGEALSAMTVVKAYGSGSYESERVRERSALRLAAGVEVARLQARFDGIVGTVRAVGTAIVLVAGVLRVSHGAISAGELLVFVSYTRKAHSPMRSLAREATKVAAAMARADRIAELLLADEVLPERPDAYRGGRARGEVEFEHVTFGYGGERPALHDVTLRIEPGDRIALTGPSGAGKSTLASLVARLVDPVEGRVLLDGHDARDCELAWLREQVAIVLQDTVLFSGTVHDNIAYATDATREDVAAAARLAAAHDFIAELPHGYDTELGPQGVGLSGGQRQRIGIARTLLRDPPVLLLDEPTTGLDAAAEEQVLDGLEALMAGRTTILITHAPRLVETARRVLRLEDGRLVEDPRAAGAARPGARRGAPLDPALPLERLLDADEMRTVLSCSLGRPVEAVAPKRVVYKPGELVAVHYRAAADGDRHDVVATAVAGTDLAERARRPRYAGLADKVNGRSPAPSPVSHDTAVNALVTWLPFDPRLPALAEDQAVLAERLRLPEPASAPELIGYKPRGRAVLRLGSHVVKAYGSRRSFEAALGGLMAASRRGPLTTGAFTAALPDLRVTVQRAVAGAPPESAAGAAALAGELLRALQRAQLGPLAAARPERQLKAAERKAAVIGAVLPELGPRLHALLRRLQATMPQGLGLVPAHGDYHADQLLVGPEGAAVVDFDDLCLAAPALDLATYAADVVRGRESDLEDLEVVLEGIVEGYGGRPEGLDWYIATTVLGRAAHPFQRQVRDWPERVGAMVWVAEAHGG